MAVRFTTYPDSSSRGYRWPTAPRGVAAPGRHDAHAIHPNPYPQPARAYHETAADRVADGRCDIASPAWMS